MQLPKITVVRNGDFYGPNEGLADCGGLSVAQMEQLTMHLT